MRLKLLFVTIALFIGLGCYGQILTFDFAGLAGNEATSTSNTNNTNLSISTISRGTGLTTLANADRYNATAWATTSIADAVTGNDYMEFTITPTSGYQFNVSSIVIQWQRSGTGNIAIALRSSVDGYAANLDAEKAVVDNTSTQTFTFTFAQANSSTAVTYRLYSYAEAAGGTGGPGDSTTPTANDIIVNGAVTAVSTDEVDYANLQFPGTGNINVGGAFNVYAQTYEPGVTEAAGAGTGIVSWIGYSSSNTDPSTAGWTWVSATFNSQSGNNDEFVANIGTALSAGTYYYASRFQLNGGPYKYGGFSSGFWNGTTNVNGTLTVNSHLVDWANLQSPPTSAITQGSTFTAYGQVFEPGLTNSSASQGAGITVDFGISPINSNTNPNTWTNWTVASYNSSCLSCGDLDFNGIPDNDEYSATTGSALTAGTYYYTFRYSLNGGPYMYGGYNAGGGGFWSGTDISGVLTVTTPTITITPTTLTGFTYVNGSGPSSNQTYTVSGTNLSADISITAPTDYEICLTSGGTYSSSLSLTQSGGTVATTTIYVRLKAGLAVANYNNENIATTSTGATTKNVTCSGSVTSSTCGSESFANICTFSCTPINSGYGTRNWTGDDLGSWTATQARTDQTITGSAITIRDGVLTSPTYSTGISNLTFKTKFPFSESSGSLTIAVNGTTVGTVTYAEMNGTTPITKTITGINVSGNIVLTITSATARFTVDDVSWTCYTSCAPIVTSPTSTAITSTTATLGGNITSIGCSGVTVRGIEWSTTSGFANGTGTQVTTSGSFGTGVFTQALTGLPSGAVIYYKAFATNLTGTGYSVMASFTTPITNDLCGGAIDLIVNAAAKASIMTGSTATTPFVEKDVWFSFTPSCSGTHNIKVTGFSGDIDIELYSTACPTSTTYLDNSSGTTATETITSSLTAGVTYYLRVLAWDSTAATTAFTAQVTSDSTLTINNTGSPATGFIVAGTNNVVVMGFTTTPNCATSYNLTGVTMSKTGTSTTTDISNLRIFYDANSNGVIDGGETSVSGTGIALSTSMVFTLSGQTGITTARNYLLVADVAVSAIGGNTFIGKITTSANLTAVLTPTGTVTGTATGNTQTITYAGPEINVTTNTPSNIPTGSVAGTGFNTQFAATAIGASTAAKTYRIYNLGSSTLNVTGITSSNTEFAVTSATPYAIVPGAYVSFTVIFSPSSSGTRTAIISIANNDGTNDGPLTENPYTFNVKGDGTCAASTNTITPTSGPTGTEVTINSAADLTGATVSFNGVSATVVQISLNQIKAVVPVGATSGNLVTTNSIGCSSTNAFTVIKNVGNSCEGGSLASDLFISEVTDSNYGGLTYLEIYNGTGVTKNLSGYSINTASNGGAYSGTPLTLNNVNLASGSIYVIALGDDDLCTSPGADGSLAAQVISGLGINFDPYQNTSPPKGNDHIALFNGATKIDSWGVYGNPSWATSTLSIFATETDGVTFRRKNTATLPSTTYDNSDWDIIDFVGTNKEDCSNNDYTDIGTYNFISGTPPTVTIPSYTSTCKTATLTVSGTEGYNGTAPADTKELAYQWFVSAPGATGWTEITDNTNYTGSLTATLSIANISTVINYQYYCQIRENTNTCYTASNAVKIIDGTITWNGTDWRDVNNAITTPSISKLAVINADYDTSANGSFSACSVVVNTLYTLTITANEYVKIQNDLTNNGNLDIEDDGSLVQVSDSGINTGSISYERITPPIFRTDYTYWSSPVANYTLGGVSQNLTLWDKYYSYDSSAETWKQESSATSMLAGIGYIIRGPESPFLASFDAFFTGVPNNGVYSIPNVAEDKSYLLGNPYPSALDADAFLDANSAVLDGTLYFWTHKTPMNLAENIPNPGLGWAYTYSLDDYAAYNPVGGIGINDVAFSSGGSPAPNGSEKPTGKIASGQGFFASSKAITSGTTIVYNNSMRVDNINESIMNNSQFFKTRNPATKTALLEKHRIWLNLKNPQGAFKQTLIGYITNATNGYDSRFDGETFDANEFVDFYSVNQDKNLVIQGRALPFNENDEVPLGFRTSIEGPFTINIDQVDGALANQAVFIEDKLMNTVFDLKSGNYTFNTVAGTFNNRFILRYTNKTLGTNDLETQENQILVSTKNKQIKINSAVEIMDKILVYDLLGRELFKKGKVNSNELTLTNFTSSQQTLLVKVSLQNGQVVTKKIIY